MTQPAQTEIDSLKQRIAHLLMEMRFAKDRIIAIHAMSNPHHGGACPALQRLNAVLMAMEEDEATR